MAAYEQFDERLELFFGNASDAVCHVYARLNVDALHSELELSGTLTGPSCLYANTLPATIRFVDSGPGKSLLARAVLPEPCFWTPDMPHLYRATMELRTSGRLGASGQVVARCQREVGIRTLGAAGRSLLYDANRWVLRGALSDARLPAHPNLEGWREHDLALVVRRAPDALCQAANRVGVLLVVQLDSFDAREFARLTRHASVGVISLPASAAIDLGGVAHNVVLAARFEPHDPVNFPNWAHVAMFVSSDATELARRIAACPVAAIAVRPAPTTLDLVASRAACDLLQRDLVALSAPGAIVDPAGFVV